VFIHQKDEETAISLFTVALEGFTYIDVHRSRAECMLRLGDISREHNELLKAQQLWETARPLFEHSSQAKQVKDFDDRLAGVRQGATLKQQLRGSVGISQYTLIDRHCRGGWR
jgi:hypothetical protein